MLSQFYIDPDNGWTWPVCAAYSNGHVCPSNPATTDGWALVRVNPAPQQLEAAAQDPRVKPYRTLWDPITPETVTAYQGKGATAGMMLGQLIQLLAQSDPGYSDI